MRIDGALNQKPANKYSSSCFDIEQFFKQKHLKKNLHLDAD